MCSAALTPDRKPSPSQLGNPIHGRSAAIKERERLMEHAPKRNQLVHLDSGRQPALDKTYIDAIRRVVQLLEIVQRPFGRQDLQFYAVAREDPAVLLGREAESAAFRAAGDRDRAGRRGTHEPVGSPDRGQGDQNQRTNGHHEIPEGNSYNPSQGASRKDFMSVLLRHRRTPRFAFVVCMTTGKFMFTLFIVLNFKTDIDFDMASA